MGLSAGTQYQVRVTANDAAGDALAQSSQLVSTSRYLLTFRVGTNPSRADDGDITVTTPSGDSETVTATVWVPSITSDQRTDTVTIQFSSMDDPNDPSTYNGIDVDDPEQLKTLGLLAVSEADIGHGELTIRPRDNNKRSFNMEFECTEPATKVRVTVYDDQVDVVERGSVMLSCPALVVTTPGPGDTASDAFTVASYGDWEYDDVTDGFILDVSNGNEHMVNAHHNETGLLSRDEPVMHAIYTLGVSYMETLRNLADGSPRRVKDDPDNKLTRQERNAYVEVGQRTVEVLAGQPNVQLTVTSKMEGPTYIRFLDSDMQPFGTDVDEEPMCGAPTWWAWTAKAAWR